MCDEETCECANRRDGFTERADGLWVHAACGRPTRLYLDRALRDGDVPRR